MGTEFTAELPPQEDLGPGRETVVVRFADGQREEFRLHEYDRVYAVPGLYEDVVQRQLDCRSPEEVAGMLARAAATAPGWAPRETRVLDVGAGNGVSGEALAAHGLVPLVGVDIRESARAAALRDRPPLYEVYLATDLLGSGERDERARAQIRALEPNVLACVGAVGPGHLPRKALAAAVGLLAPDALVAYTRAAPQEGAAAPTNQATWAAELEALGAIEELDRRRYRHRNTVNGAPILWEASVLRVRRPI